MDNASIFDEVSTKGMQELIFFFYEEKEKFLSIQGVPS